MSEQISIFTMLGEYEMPTFSRETLADGSVGWYVETTRYTASHTDHGPYKRIVCRVRKVRLRQHGDHFWWDTIDHSDYYAGGTHWEKRTLFRRYPTDRDILRCANEQLASDPRAEGAPRVIEKLKEAST